MYKQGAKITQGTKKIFFSGEMGHGSISGQKGRVFITVELRKKEENLRRVLIPLMVLILVATLSAQIRTGNIFGRVLDQDGNALPGVSVTLIPAAGAPLVTVSSTDGAFRFVSLAPANTYKVKAELRGFKSRTEENIIVGIGNSTNVTVKMEQGVLEEQVTVVAVSPVVDTKKTATGKNVNQEMLQSMPTARDPWVIMQMAPSIIMDRENVGGNESGQQAGYVAKGDTSAGGNNIWSLDGVVVTDPAAIGASPTYWDFDSFEEMQITTGGSDVTIQTGGVALNMVTKRGGNLPSIGGRVYYTDNHLESDKGYITSALAAEGLTQINKINSIKDYGVNIGGPIVRDHAWLWGSFGIQDIDNLSIVGTPIKPVLKDYNLKLNLQFIPQNRFEFLVSSGDKDFIGRSASASFPSGLHQRSSFAFGSPILKLQDEHMFGDDLLVSLRWGYSGNSWGMFPGMDETLSNLASYSVGSDLWTGSQYYYVTTRPMYDYNASLNYFNDSLFGVKHDIKVGVEYSTRRVTTDSSTPGNVVDYTNFNYETISPTGTGTPEIVPGIQQLQVFTQWNLDYQVSQLAGYFSDTVSIGKLSLLLGLRYDRQTPSVNSSVYHTIMPSNGIWQKYIDSTTATVLHAQLPDTTMPNINPNYHWNVFSPRLGLTYDLFGNGKTVFKLNFAMYGDFMGSGMAGYFNLLGPGGWMNFWWLDANNDGKANSNELYWNDPTTYAPQRVINDAGQWIGDYAGNAGTNWGSFTPGTTTLSPNAYKVDSNAGSSKTTEYLASVEQELFADFGLGLDFTYRHYNNFTQDVPMTEDGVDRSMASYVVAGTVPSSIAGIPSLGAAAGKPWYVLSPTTAYTPYYHHTLNSSYAGYWGLAFRFTKRLSHKWMLDGSASYMDQWYHYGSDAYINPTNLWAQQDQIWAPSLGGASGKIGQYIFSHWMFKIEGLYQLPFDFAISGTFNARNGHIIPQYFTMADSSLQNPFSKSASVYLSTFGTFTLPVFYQLNLRIEKMVKIGNGRAYIMADLFNALNTAVINRRYDQNYGTYQLTTNHLAPYANSYKINEVLNPRILRLGVRFQF
jgi:hypothetical protein